MPFFLIIPEGYRFDLLLFLVYRFGILFVPWSSSFTFVLLLFGCVSLLVSWMKIWAANIVVVWWRCICLETIVWQLVHFLWNSQRQITADLSWGCCRWFLFDFSFLWIGDCRSRIPLNICDVKKQWPDSYIDEIYVITLRDLSQQLMILLFVLFFQLYFFAIWSLFWPLDELIIFWLDLFFVDDFWFKIFLHENHTSRGVIWIDAMLICLHNTCLPLWLASERKHYLSFPIFSNIIFFYFLSCLRLAHVLPLSWSLVFLQDSDLRGTRGCG